MNDTFLIKLHQEVVKITGSDIEKINYQTDLSEIGLDSLNLLELLFQIENQYGVKVELENTDATQSIKTVADLKNLIDTALTAKAKDEQ